MKKVLYSPNNSVAEFSRPRGARDKKKRKRRKKRILSPKNTKNRSAEERSRVTRQNVRVVTASSREVRGWVNTIRRLSKELGI